MVYDPFVPPEGDRFDVEGIREFWGGVLNRVKAYAESSEAGSQQTIEGTDGSPEGGGGDVRRGRRTADDQQTWKRTR
jgi:hypothetical protein